MEGLIVLWIVFSLLVGAFWLSKKRSFWGGLFIAVFLSPLIGFIIGLVLKPNVAKQEEEAIAHGTMKKCPYCAEMIKNEAIVCRFCGKDLHAKDMKGTVNESKRDENLNKPEDSSNMIYCPYCGSKTNEKTCQKCGKNIDHVLLASEYSCSRCKKDIPEDSSYCWFCGDKIE
jgi:RNA polymerase subunit RPABC4/transcription elongation factor Spt4